MYMVLINMSLKIYHDLLHYGNALNEFKLSGAGYVINHHQHVEMLFSFYDFSLAIGHDIFNQMCRCHWDLAHITPVRVWAM